MKRSSGNDTSISPQYKISNWIEARDGLNWRIMIDIFEDRMKGRFLKPIELIASDKGIGKFSGFAILALDCLLIETLHQFYDETVGEHREAFWNFFKSSKHFTDSFSREKAFVFYSHFRCGLLHQAQTKKGSLVKVGKRPMIASISKEVEDGLIVNREKFHAAIKMEIESYKESLSNGDEVLRSRFIKKMNFICDC